MKFFVFVVVLSIPISSLADSKRCDSGIGNVGINNNGNLTVYFSKIYYKHPNRAVRAPQQLTLTACNVVSDGHCKSWQALLTAALLSEKLVLVDLNSSQRIPSCANVPQTSTAITQLRLSRATAP